MAFIFRKNTSHRKKRTGLGPHPSPSQIDENPSEIKKTKKAMSGVLESPLK
jgi:hypothetical protein